MARRSKVLTIKSRRGDFVFQDTDDPEKTLARAQRLVRAGKIGKDEFAVIEKMARTVKPQR